MRGKTWQELQKLGIILVTPYYTKAVAEKKSVGYLVRLFTARRAIALAERSVVEMRKPKI